MPSSERERVAERHLRPGGTVSGPTMFGLADVAVYLAILARIGPVALAVTTNGSIDFLRKPAAGVDLLGEARLLKLGRVLAVGDVLIRSEGMEEPVARAGLTYSIPPKR
ncbi:MAG: PaaI family thioesterase [Albidovulum sp.]